MPKISFSLDNLMSGCAALICRNKFYPGFDKMIPDAAETWLRINGNQLYNQLNGGKYKVMPASGSYSAKSDGSYHQLARLTSIDTIIQTELIDKLSENTSSFFPIF